MKLEKSDKMEEELGEAKQEVRMEEEFDTPERKNGLWSQQMDNCSTIKKEAVAPSPPKPAFKTPPKKTTKPTLEELERWERIDRDNNRRHN